VPQCSAKRKNGANASTHAGARSRAPIAAGLLPGLPGPQGSASAAWVTSSHPSRELVPVLGRCAVARPAVRGKARRYTSGRSATVRRGGQVEQTQRQREHQLAYDRMREHLAEVVQAAKGHARDLDRYQLELQRV
jgi:hypothetical protein